MIIVRYATTSSSAFNKRLMPGASGCERERCRNCVVATSREDRLIEFGRFAAESRGRRGLGKPETFNFLGFTFICGKSCSGKFLIRRKTRRDRMRAKLRMIKEEMRRRMHLPIPIQGKWLGQVVAGYFRYHAVPTNSRALVAFRYHVANIWRRTLARRSQKDKTTWERMRKMVADWLQRRASCTPGPMYASPSLTRGGSRSGKAARTVLWGGLSNEVYRDP